MRSETQDFSVDLPRLSFDHLLLAEDANGVDLREGDHLLLRSVVVDSVEVCVGKYSELPVRPFPAQLNPILIEVVGVLAEDVNSLGYFHFSTNQHVKTLGLLTFPIHHLVLLHLHEG